MIPSCSSLVCDTGPLGSLLFTRYLETRLLLEFDSNLPSSTDRLDSFHASGTSQKSSTGVPVSVTRTLGSSLLSSEDSRVGLSIPVSETGAEGETFTSFGLAVVAEGDTFSSVGLATVAEGDTFVSF